MVSSDAYNRARPDVIVMAVTSQFSSYSRLGEVVVADWKMAGLLKASIIKPILTTIEKVLVIRTLGRLERDDLSGLRDALIRIIG